MNEESLDTLEISLIDSVTDSHLEELFEGVADITLDALTNEPLLSAIPIFGTLSKLYGGAVAIRDQLFLRKVHAFLTVLADTSIDERNAFMEELIREQGTRTRAGQSLLLLLERLDDLHKPELIGKVYRARLKGTISLADMQRFAYIIDRAYLSDLLAIKDIDSGTRLDGLLGHQLAGLGLVSVTGEDYGTFDGIGAETWYELNELGVAFKRIIFDEETTNSG